MPRKTSGATNAAGYLCQLVHQPPCDVPACVSAGFVCHDGCSALSALLLLLVTSLSPSSGFGSRNLPLPSLLG